MPEFDSALTRQSDDDWTHPVRSGRAPSVPGSRPTGQAASRLVASRFDPSRITETEGLSVEDLALAIDLTGAARAESVGTGESVERIAQALLSERRKGWEMFRAAALASRATADFGFEGVDDMLRALPFPGDQTK